MEEYLTHSPEETERLGEEFAERLRGDEVLAFSGGLGMGKTAFVRGLARGLGVQDDVSSPTFALVNQYAGGRAMLYHFDMYRVGSWDDLYSTGFFDDLSMGILAVEWSENIDGALEDPVRIDFSRGEGENDRIIRITMPDSRQKGLEAT